MNADKMVKCEHGVRGGREGYGCAKCDARFNGIAMVYPDGTPCNALSDPDVRRADDAAHAARATSTTTWTTCDEHDVPLNECASCFDRARRNSAAVMQRILDAGRRYHGETADIRATARRVRRVLAQTAVTR